MTISLSPLFSGSRGNCSLVRTQDANILLDAGYNYKQIAVRLEQMGVALSDVNAILVTHEHTDHVSALPYLTRATGVEVFAPKQIVSYVSQRSYSPNVFAVANGMEIKGVRISVYPCSHDSIACVGYKFTCGQQSVASVTDTGTANEELTEFLYDCKGIMLESNHDVDMLKSGAYPYVLKRRILSDFGHLSNEQAAKVITSLKGSNVKEIALAHLSEHNNTKEIAFNRAVKALSDADMVEGRDVKIYVADQYVNRITLC